MKSSNPCLSIRPIDKITNLDCIRTIWNTLGCKSNPVNYTYTGSWYNNMSKKDIISDMQTYVNPTLASSLATKDKSNLCYGDPIGVKSISWNQNICIMVLNNGSVYSYDTSLCFTAIQRYSVYSIKMNQDTNIGSICTACWLGGISPMAGAPRLVVNRRSPYWNAGASSIQPLAASARNRSMPAL